MAQHHKYHYFEKSQVSVGYKNPPRSRPGAYPESTSEGAKFYQGSCVGSAASVGSVGSAGSADTSVGVDGSAAPS